MNRYRGRSSEPRTRQARSGVPRPAFVDRNHRYLDDSASSLPVPAYLVGSEYIMSGNDNRDNATYRLDVTLSTPAAVYMLIDNRLGDADNATPPTFDATHMQWILDEGWAATANGLNRGQDAALPDELAIDEGADDTINQYYSVYRKDFAAGTFSLYQADNAGQNMYGVVVTPIPEPSALSLASLGLLAFASRRSAAARPRYSSLSAHTACRDPNRRSPPCRQGPPAHGRGTSLA